MATPSPQRILAASHDVPQVERGSLYPALHRLERKVFVTAEWQETDSGRMAKIYALTSAMATLRQGDLEA